MVYTTVSCVRNYLKNKPHLQGAFYLHDTESSTFLIKADKSGSPAFPALTSSMIPPQLCPDLFCQAKGTVDVQYMVAMGL